MKLLVQFGARAAYARVVSKAGFGPTRDRPLDLPFRNYTDRKLSDGL